MSATGPTAEAHLRRMADVLDEARQGLADDVPPRSLLFGLQRLVDADTASFSETDIPTRLCLNQQDTDPDDPGGDSVDGYWRWRHQHLLCLQVSRPHSSPETTQMADFMSVRRLTNLAIYTEFIAPMKSIATITLPTAPNRTRVFQFFREAPKPFTDHEMFTLQLMAPHVYELYREAARRRRPGPPHPPRTRCPALPRPRTEHPADRRTALRLAQHRPQAPENVFNRLGVSSRTAALARVFPEHEAP